MVHAPGHGSSPSPSRSERRSTCRWRDSARSIAAGRRPDVLIGHDDAEFAALVASGRRSITRRCARLHADRTSRTAARCAGSAVTIDFRAGETTLAARRPPMTSMTFPVEFSRTGASVHGCVVHGQQRRPRSRQPGCPDAAYGLPMDQRPRWEAGPVE